MGKSTHICLRCGLPLTRWLDGWKHCANGHAKSCGKPPHVVHRATHNIEMAALRRAAAAFVKGESK